jgi:hypothetical protein
MSDANKKPEGIPSPFQKEDIGYTDAGHTGLITDIRKLLKEAMDYDFHDYKNKKYPAPKAALIAHLSQMVSRAQNGWYDNKTEV